MKKGFTLIELLAVIIVLAIIALITVPITLNVIEEARKKADRNSVYGLIDGAKIYYAECMMDESKRINLNGQTNLINLITFSGTRPNSGAILMNNMGQIQLSLVYRNTCYTKIYEEETITESDDIENCVPKLPPNAFEISTTNITRTSIELSAYTTDIDGEIVEYEYYLNGTRVEGLNTSNGTLTGLVPETEYEIYVVAIDNDGKRTQSNTIRVTIELPAPNAFTISSTIESFNNIKLSAETTDPDGTVDSYEYWMDGEKVEGLSVANATITGVAEGTHRIYVVAIDNDRKRTQSNTIDVTISLNSPNAFTISATNVTANSIELSASTTDPDGLTLTYKYYVNGNPVEGLSASNATIPNLNPLTNYSIYVVATNSNNKSTESNNTIQVTTKFAVGAVVYFNPVDGVKCDNYVAANSNAGVKQGCMKWYIYSQDEDNYNMILDHNTTAIISWNNSGIATGPSTEFLNQLKSDTDGWVGVTTRTDSYSLQHYSSNYTINYNGYKARLITGNELATILDVSDFSETSTNSHHQAYTPPNWLNDNITLSDGTKGGYFSSSSCRYYDSYGANMTVWVINLNGFSFAYSNNSAVKLGIRPVITIEKSKLQ